MPLQTYNCFGFFTIYLFFRRFPPSEKSFRYIIYFSLIVFVSHGLLQWASVLDSSNPYFKITGMYFNPSPYSIVLAFLTSYCFLISFMFYSDKHYISTAFTVFLILLGIVLLYTCGSRSSWTAFYLTTIIIIFFTYKIKFNLSKSFTKKLIILILLSFIAFIILIFFIKEKSAYGRFYTWKICLQYLNHNFLFGIGEGKFAANFPKYQLLFFNSSPNNIIKYSKYASDIRFAFNDFLQIAVETGILGALLFTLIISILFFLTGKNIYNSFILKKRNFHNLGIAVMVLSILIAGITSYPLSILPINAIFYILIALLVNQLVVAKKATVIPIKPNRIYVILIKIIFLLTSIFIFIRAEKTYKSFSVWADTVNEGSAKLKANIYESLYQNLQDNGDFLYAMANNYVVLGKLDHAIRIFELAVQINPSVKLRLALADTYLCVGKDEKALLIYTFIASSYPDLLVPKYKLAKLYLKFKNIDKFKKVSAQILSINNNFESNLSIQIKHEIKFLMMKCNGI